MREKKEDRMNEVVRFRLRTEEKEALERLAEYEGRSVSNLIRRWIEVETRKMEKEKEK